MDGKTAAYVSDGQNETKYQISRQAAKGSFYLVITEIQGRRDVGSIKEVKPLLKEVFSMQNKSRNYEIIVMGQKVVEVKSSGLSQRKVSLQLDGCALEGNPSEAEFWVLNN